MSKVICKFCEKKFGCKKINDHLSECIINYIDDKKGYLIEFIANNNFSNNIYQMFAIFGSKCKFSDIINFINETWCNCCGHLSILYMFEYFDEKKTCQKLKLNTLIKKYEHANQFRYEYDMGDTTTIFFRIVQILEKDNTTNIELVYRNEPHKFKCFDCNNNAEYIFEQNLVCDLCKDNIDEPELVNKLNNSPRDGVNCYG
jgi:hypothetical protein